MNSSDDEAKIKSIYRYSIMLNNLFQEKVTEEMKRLGEEFNLPKAMKFSYFSILCELSHKNCSIYLTELSKRIGVKLPNVSNQVNELIQAGLVEQVPSVNNKRKVSVQLSKTGIEYSDIFVKRLVKVAKDVYGTDEETANVFSYYKLQYERHFKED